MSPSSDALVVTVKQPTPHRRMYQLEYALTPPGAVVVIASAPDAWTPLELTRLGQVILYELAVYTSDFDRLVFHDTTLVVDKATDRTWGAPDLLDDIVLVEVVQSVIGLLQLGLRDLQGLTGEAGEPTTQEVAVVGDAPFDGAVMPPTLGPINFRYRSFSGEADDDWPTAA